MVSLVLREERKIVIWLLYYVLFCLWVSCKEKRRIERGGIRLEITIWSFFSFFWDFLPLSPIHSRVSLIRNTMFTTSGDTNTLSDTTRQFYGGEFLSFSYSILKLMLQINLTVSISTDIVRRIHDIIRNGQLQEILVLHLENGRDYFIPVSATYNNSCFGTTIEKLLSARPKKEVNLIDFVSFFLNFCPEVVLFREMKLDSSQTTVPPSSPAWSTVSWWRWGLAEQDNWIRTKSSTTECSIRFEQLWRQDNLMIWVSFRLKCTPNVSSSSIVRLFVHALQCPHSTTWLSWWAYYSRRNVQDHSQGNCQIQDWCQTVRFSIYFVYWKSVFPGCGQLFVQVFPSRIKQFSSWSVWCSASSSVRDTNSKVISWSYHLYH